MNFKEKLESGKFVHTLEITTPKGVDMSYAFEKCEILREKMDAINVTDSSRSVMKIGSIGAAKLLQDKGFETICQISGKDRNIIAIQSDLLSAYALGIKNILALTGDPPILGDHPNAKKVFELDSTGILKTINTLNEGHDLAGNQLFGKTDFFAGATFNPNFFSIEKTVKKIDAGAKFFQTQLVFESKKFIATAEKLKQYNVKILAGIMPLNSIKMAQFIKTKLSGISVPDSILKEFETSNNPQKTGIEIAKRTIAEVKKHCAGIHFMPLKHEEVILEIIE